MPFSVAGGATATIFVLDSSGGLDGKSASGDPAATSPPGGPADGTRPSLKALIRSAALNLAYLIFCRIYKIGN